MKLLRVLLALGCLGAFVSCGEAGGDAYDACTTNPRLPARYGNISLQQASAGGAVQVGFYPAAAYRGSRYVSHKYVNGKSIGAITHSYAPHDSFKASLVKTGDRVTWFGDSYYGATLLLHVEITCVG